MNDRTLAGRRLFLLVAALFFIPLIAAWLLFFVWPELRPEGRTNYGQLLTPARPVPDLHFIAVDGKSTDAEVLKGKWSLVYLGGANCEKACQEKLFQVRQIRILLNQDRDRVQRVYIAPDAAALQATRGALGQVQADLVYLAEAPTGARAHEFFQPREADAIYLLDPLGNWLMIYAADSDYKRVLKDLKYLLKLSHIG